MRTTMHNGRTHKNGKPFSAKHNDRDFDHSQDGHIDSEKINDNVNWQLNEGMSFEENELKFYRENYSEQLERVNQNAIESGHKERVKTIEDYYKSPKLCPEEALLEIGSSKDGTVDRETFLKCVEEYVEEFNKRYSSNAHILDYSLHYDEPSSAPHCHLRIVYDFENEFGMKEINQNQALKELGFERPNLDKKEGRYNNAKMSFDEFNRYEIWYGILEKNGVEFEREPIKTKKYTKELRQFKYDTARELEEENKRLKAEKEKLEQEYQSLLTEYEELTEDVTLLNARNINLKKEKESLVSGLKEKQQELDNFVNHYGEILQANEGLKQENEGLKQENERLKLEKKHFESNVERLSIDFERLDKRYKEIGLLEEKESSKDIDLKVLESRMKKPKKDIGIELT